MHDIWNPWHGCKKKSEGCQHCYMYYLDKQRDMDSFHVRKNKDFYYPLKKDRQGNYKIKAGEQIKVCMTSDFFIEEADPWRKEAFSIIKERSDVIFYLLTKRIERVKQCLPADWEEGYENVFLNVSCENQKRADERIPLLLNIKAKHKGIMCAPLLSSIHIEPYLASQQIEQVNCEGENYDGNRPCDYSWVVSLAKQCRKENVTFAFIGTGNTFIKEGKTYHIPRHLQSFMAFKSNLSYQGRKPVFHLYDDYQREIAKEELYVPYFKEHCYTCGQKIICNGCSFCGKCKK